MPDHPEIATSQRTAPYLDWRLGPNQDLTTSRTGLSDHAEHASRPSLVRDRTRERLQQPEHKTTTSAKHSGRRPRQNH